MITIDSLKLDFNDNKKAIVELKNAFNLDALMIRKQELEKNQQEEGFWEDMAKAKVVNKELARVESKIKQYNALENRVNDLEVLIDICEEENDEEEFEAIDEENRALKKDISEAKISALLKGKYDANNAILTLHAGAGGTEAQDWAEMLFRMYSRYCEKMKFKLKVLDSLPGDEAGIKSISFMVEGDNAYGYLKAEKGVHRLVRISPFDSNARRHTSFASLEVMPEVEEDDEIVINPDDIRIDTFRSSGAGGQKVNKTDSAIRITHFPTGIVVSCQNERSQVQNKEVAFQMLKSKLIEIQERERQEKEAEIKGEIKKIEWGSQIRSYVFCPYTLVKDHRTNYENPNINAVMDGDIEGFINDYLIKTN